MTEQSFKALRAEIENVVSSLEHRAPSCFQLIAEEVQGLREWLDASQCLQRGQCGTRSAMATMPSQPQIASAHLKQALKQECDKLIHGDLLHIRILGYIDAFKSETQVFLMRMLMAIKTPEIHDFHNTVWARFHLLRLLDKYRELKRAHLKTRNRRQRVTSALDELVRYIYRNDEQSSSPNAAQHRRMRRALQARVAHGRKWGLIRDRLSLKAVASISANRNKGEGVSVVMNTEYVRFRNYWRLILRKNGTEFTGLPTMF